MARKGNPNDKMQKNFNEVVGKLPIIANSRFLIVCVNTSIRHELPKAVKEKYVTLHTLIRSYLQSNFSLKRKSVKCYVTLPKIAI